MLESIAIHKCDCLATQHDHHYSSWSNPDAYHLQLKSAKVFKEHRSLHSDANCIKHDPVVPVCAASVDAKPILHSALEARQIDAAMQTLDVNALGQLELAWK